uniref:DUF5843 protein n=1 Tax=Clandestinovirus TaxID=2831644 RepID=A0A8F8KRB4_9VIRU|nr:DUF5843 protein [Clandestinovirus]
MSRFSLRPSNDIIVPHFDEKNMPSLPKVEIGVTVQLSLDDAMYAIDIGVKRMLANLRAKTKERKQTKRSPWEITIQGVMGELAFHRLFNMSHDLDNTECRSALNDTYDAQVGNVVMDIKTTLSSYYNGNAPIRTPAWKRTKPPHVSVLMLWTNFPQTLMDVDTVTVNETLVHAWAEKFKNLIKSSSLLPTFEFKGMVDSHTLFNSRHYNSMRCQYELEQEYLKTWEECLSTLVEKKKG